MPTTQKRNNLLVFGYVRENTLQTHLIPTAIIKLFEAFHENLIHWKLKQKNRKFWKTNGPQFTLNGIKFELIFYKTLIFDTSNQPKDRASLWLKVDTDSLSLNISTFDVDVGLNGNIFNEKYKKQYRIHFDNDYHCDQGKRCGDAIIDSQVIKNGEDIDISFRFQIVNIQNMPSMPRHSTLNWTLNENEMELFKTTKSAKTIIKSKVFNDWIIELQPFGRACNRRGDRVICRIKPVLVAYPLVIDHFVIKCNLRMVSNNNDDEAEVFNYDENKECTRNGVEYHLLCSRFSKTNKLSVSLDIHIKKVHFKYGVDADVWKQCGILTDS